MAVAVTYEPTSRLERAESSRLAIAFMLSLTLHMLVFGTFQLGKKLHWWQRWAWPAWVKPARMITELLPHKPVTPPPKPQEAPLVFIEVSPAQASVEPPKAPKFYSSQNSVAANPDTTKDTATPLIDGSQKQIVKTEDVPREKYTPLQPTPPAQTAKQEQSPAKAVNTESPGQLAMAKPDPSPRKEDGQESRPKPRTILEALARQPENKLAGQKSQQEGGVRRHLEITALDAKVTSFGSYDYAFIRAVEQRWFALLDERGYASDSRGKVVLRFSLHTDGRITDMNVAENSAGDVLGFVCQRAVLDNAPYEAWPTEMRLEIGADSRFIQFTFYYN